MLSTRPGNDDLGRLPVVADRHSCADPAPTVAALYVTQRLAMIRLACLLVDDQHTAEDVVQDAFANLHRQWPRLRDHQAAVAYLRRSVINNARSVLRRRRTSRAYIRPAAVPEPGADHAVLLAEEHRQVLEVLARLPARQREVLALRYWSGLSDAEIAETLGIRVVTVRSTISRGLDRLENAIGW